MMQGEGHANPVVGERPVQVWDTDTLWLLCWLPVSVSDFMLPLACPDSQGSDTFESNPIQSRPHHVLSLPGHRLHRNSATTHNRHATAHGRTTTEPHTGHPCHDTLVQFQPTPCHIPCHAVPCHAKRCSTHEVQASCPYSAPTWQMRTYCATMDYAVSCRVVSCHPMPCQAKRCSTHEMQASTTPAMGVGALRRGQKHGCSL